MDKLNPDDPRPPYQQVAEALRLAIADGRYEVGAKLPAHNAVAEEYGVALGTVKRAFADLQRDGLIVTRQGQGSYVRAVTAEPSEEDSELARLRKAVDTLTARVGAIERQLAKRKG